MFVHWLWPDSSGTVPLHWVGWNIPLWLGLLSSKPSSSMGWRGSSVWEWEREEICGRFPFIFAVVLLETDMHFPSTLLAHRFATRRDGRRKTAKRLWLLLGVFGFRKRRTNSQTHRWCQLADIYDGRTGKMIYTVWASGPAEEECFALQNMRWFGACILKSIFSVKIAVGHSSLFSVMCLPPVAFPSLARGRAVLWRIWRWWPLLTTTNTYFSANLTIKIISQFLPMSLKSVRSCKNAAFEEKVLMQKRLYVLFRGFQTWLKSGSGVFIVLGFMGYVLSNWAVKMGQAPHSEKQ